MQVIIEFETLADACGYRHDHGTGGWIFEPEDSGKVVLFPPHFAPADIFNHPITRGRSGNLVGSA